jgi:hypothetical protein
VNIDSKFIVIFSNRSIPSLEIIVCSTKLYAKLDLNTTNDLEFF